MTFQERVRNKWWSSIIMGVAGFLIGEVLVWAMMSFVVFVSIQISAPEQRRLLLVVVQFLVGITYLWAWSVRGIQQTSIDVILRDAGPIERDIIRARIVQEAQEAKNGTGR